MPPVPPPLPRLRRALTALLVALLAAVLVYGVASRRGAVYEARGSLMAAADPGGRLLAAAPALPLGALEQALHSGTVVDAVVARLRPSGLDAAHAQRLAQTLRAELAEQDFRIYRLSAQLDERQSGTYLLRARGASPQEAKVLADSALAALLAWDRARAERALAALRASLAAYGRSVERRLAQTSDPLARGALEGARQNTAQRLVELEQAQQAVTGTLSPLAAAVAPTRPVARGGVRPALLAFVAAFALAYALGGRLGTLRAVLARPAAAAGQGRPGSRA